jgi:prevent-host-death family protein
MHEIVVSAAEANRDFWEILRAVGSGRSYVVTSQGKAVARIVPARRSPDATEAAKAALMARLRAQPVRVLGERWSRDRLYEA